MQQQSPFSELLHVVDLHVLDTLQAVKQAAFWCQQLSTWVRSIPSASPLSQFVLPSPGAKAGASLMGFR